MDYCEYCRKPISNYFRHSATMKHLTNEIDADQCPICWKVYRYFGSLLKHIAKEHPYDIVPPHYRRKT